MTDYGLQPYDPFTRKPNCRNFVIDQADLIKAAGENDSAISGEENTWKYSKDSGRRRNLESSRDNIGEWMR